MLILKKKVLVREPKPRGKSRKNLAIEPITTALQITINKLDSHIKPKANEELAISITKTYNKIYEPKSYNEAVNNPIYGQR